MSGKVLGQPSSKAPRGFSDENSIGKTVSSNHTLVLLTYSNDLRGAVCFLAAGACLTRIQTVANILGIVNSPKLVK